MCAALGNYFYQKVFREWWGWKAKSIVIFNLICFSVLTCYGFIGFFSKELGLRKGWEIFAFGFFYGLNMGSIQSFSRGLMSSLIPSGMEAQLFGFYEITDKGSSFIGPAVVTVITQQTGNLRNGLFFVLPMLLVPTALLWTLDDKQGAIAARSYSRKRAGSIRLYEVKHNAQVTDEDLFNKTDNKNKVPTIDGV